MKSHDVNGRAYLSIFKYDYLLPSKYRTQLAFDRPVPISNHTTTRIDSTMAQYHLYDSSIPSGNAYKIHLILAHLQIPYTTTSLNILASPSETRSASFLSKNPNGRIPCLEILSSGTILPESNAILFYLAEGTRYLPTDKLEKAQVLQWMFFEQYSHEPYVAVYKFHTYWAALSASHSVPKTESEMQALKVKGQAAIDVMEEHLEGKTYFVAERYTIADISLFAYTQSAEVLGFEVGENVRGWLERVRGEEGWVEMKKDPLGKAP